MVARSGTGFEAVRLVLTLSQKIWAVLVALALIAGAIGSCAQGVVTYHDWACRERSASPYVSDGTSGRAARRDLISNSVFRNSGA
jgi:hypothetical protein